MWKLLPLHSVAILLFYYEKVQFFYRTHVYKDHAWEFELAASYLT